MDNEMQAIMLAAQASAARDAMFRRHVDLAVNEAMRHVEHIDSDVDRRDLYNVATVAAMAVLRQAIEGDYMLKNMEVERDRYKKLAEGSLLTRLSLFDVPSDALRS